MLIRAGLPLARDEARLGERSQNRLVQPLEELATARTVNAHRAVVQLEDELRNPLVERVERKESLVTHLRQHPSLCDEHGPLDLRLVAGALRSSRQDRRAVVARHLLVGALHPGLVPTRSRDTAFE